MVLPASENFQPWENFQFLEIHKRLRDNSHVLLLYKAKDILQGIVRSYHQDCVVYGSWQESF